MAEQSPWPSLRQMLGMSDEELAGVDPVVMNLVVAKGISALADLDIGRYVVLADKWAKELRRQMREKEVQFHNTPQYWRNDLSFFRLGMVCWYIDIIQHVAYREDQLGLTRVRYTDPSDLFINGIMYTRRGTCATLALLHVVLGQRVGLPVSLACVGSHFICRYDDGTITYNIEATDTGAGGFAAPTDDEVLARNNLPPKAQECGSDLRAVTPREMLGLFVGNRARHLNDSLRLLDAEPDHLLARYLFPRNRQLYFMQNLISVQCSAKLFEPGERGHPIEVASWMQELVRVAPWNGNLNLNGGQQEAKTNGIQSDSYTYTIIAG